MAALATLTLSEDLSRDPLCDDALPVYNVVTVDDYAPAPEKDTMKAGDVPEPEAPNAHYLGWQIDSSKESSMGHWCRLQRPPFGASRRPRRSPGNATRVLGVHARAGAPASEDTHRGKPPIESRQGKGCARAASRSGRVRRATRRAPRRLLAAVQVRDGVRILRLERGLPPPHLRGQRRRLLHARQRHAPRRLRAPRGRLRAAGLLLTRDQWTFSLDDRGAYMAAPPRRP